MLIGILVIVTLWPTSTVNHNNSPNKPDLPHTTYIPATQEEPSDLREFTPVMELLPPEIDKPNDLTMGLTGLDLEYYCLSQERKTFTGQELRKKEIIDPNAILSLWDQKTKKLQEIGNNIIIETLLENSIVPITIKVKIEGKEFIECSHPRGFCARFLIEPGDSTLYLVAGPRVPCEEGTKIDWENSIGRVFHNPSLTKNVQEALRLLESTTISDKEN